MNVSVGDNVRIVKYHGGSKAGSIVTVVAAVDSTIKYRGVGRWRDVVFSALPYMVEIVRLHRKKCINKKWRKKRERDERNAEISIRR